MIRKAWQKPLRLDETRRLHPSHTYRPASVHTSLREMACLAAASLLSAASLAFFSASSSDDNLEAATVLPDPWTACVRGQRVRWQEGRPAGALQVHLAGLNVQPEP